MEWIKGLKYSSREIPSLDKVEMCSCKKIGMINIVSVSCECKKQFIVDEGCKFECIKYLHYKLFENYPCGSVESALLSGNKETISKNV